MHIVRPASVQNDRTRGHGSSIGSNSPISKDCAGCHRAITERYMLQTMDQIWHEDCLKCSCCDCRLGEVGSTLYYKADLFLCRRDYLRLFGATGVCAVCSKVIPAFEMVMKSKSNVYHLDCFACQQCNHRFCIGDRYYLCDNRILCELDYENRITRQNIPFTQRPLSQKLTPISAPVVNSTTGNNLGPKEEGLERPGDGEKIIMQIPSNGL